MIDYKHSVKYLQKLIKAEEVSSEDKFKAIKLLIEVDKAKTEREVFILDAFNIKD